MRRTDHIPQKILEYRANENTKKDYTCTRKTESDNQHPRMAHEREMEALKDKRLHDEEKKTNIRYIKIVDKKYDDFIRDYVKSDENRPD